MMLSPRKVAHLLQVLPHLHRSSKQSSHRNKTMGSSCHEKPPSLLHHNKKLTMSQMKII
jgi:hypothetical protein